MNRIEMKRYYRPGMILPLAAAAIALSFTGCVKRELEIRPDEGYARIVLEWGGDDRPRSARYLFYDATGKMVKEVTGLTDGFEGTLPVGTYRVVVHNEDALQVDYRGIDRYETAEVFARPTSYSDGVHAMSGESCVLEPQMVFGTGACNEADEIVIRQCDTTRMTVTPVELTRSVRFLFTVTGVDRVNSFTGVLQGVVSGVFLCSGKYNSSTSCTVEFEASPATRAAALEYVADVGVFSLLTTTQSSAGTNKMTVTLTLSDGSRSTGTFDLTETLQKIILGNEGQYPLHIPVDITLRVEPLGRLSATVEPWDNSGSGGGNPRPQP